MSELDWSQKYKKAINEKPAIGHILKTITGEPVKINVELTTGKTPFLYARLYVPCIVGEKVGWFARSITDNSIQGWKAILLPKARDYLINHPVLPLNLTSIGVESIKIVRTSKQGKSLLVEISDVGSWIDEYLAAQELKEKTNEEDHPTDSGSEDSASPVQPDVPCEVHQEDERGGEGNAVPVRSEEVSDTGSGEEVQPEGS